MRVYTSYRCCVFEQEQEFNQNRWTGAWVSYQLARYFGDCKDSYEKWCSGLGMFQPKKKKNTNIIIDKQAEIDKANISFMENFLSNKWD